jgi:hypothetical protein
MGGQAALNSFQSAILQHYSIIVKTGPALWRGARADAGGCFLLDFSGEKRLFYNKVWVRPVDLETVEARVKAGPAGNGRLMGNGLHLSEIEFRAPARLEAPKRRFRWT